MIEFCSKKRMVIAIVGLVIISIVTVMFETRWSTNHQLKDVRKKGKPESLNKTCKSGTGNVVESCSVCSNEELTKGEKYCQETGFKEVVLCDDGKKVTRQCPTTTWEEKKKFWMFEGVMLVVGLLSYALVLIRQKKLDLMLQQKIDRQIAAGI